MTRADAHTRRIRLTSVEFVRDPAAASEHAKAEPVTEGNRDEVVILSAAEYARLKAKDVRGRMRTLTRAGRVAHVRRAA